MAKKRIKVAFGDLDKQIKTRSATVPKNDNFKKMSNSLDELLINAIYGSPREELLYDTDSLSENIQIFKCPEIDIKI